MTAHDLLELAGRNLRESKVRNGLTTIGIGVGIASLVSMLSLGAGLQELATKRLNRSGLFDTVFVYSKRDLRSPGREHRENINLKDVKPLDSDARADLSKLPNVIEVYPEIRFFTEVKLGEKSQLTSIAAVPQSARKRESFDNLKGGFFSAAQANEAILQSDFAKQLEPKSDSLIGKDLIIRYAERQASEPNSDEIAAAMAGAYSVVPKEKSFRIVGIVEGEPDGGMRGPARARVLIPVQVADDMHVMQPFDMRGAVSDSGKPIYNALVLRVSQPKLVEGVEDGVKKMGFAAFSLLDMTKSLRRFFAVLDLFLAIFGSLALAVASLGIANTLLMAILERRHEIGIMKAIGASDTDVKKIFFSEAGAMGLAGGAIGVLGGWLIGRVINFGTNLYMQQQQMPAEDVWFVPWWLIAGAIAFSVIMSLFSGLYPAARAAKLDPVQALRYE